VFENVGGTILAGGYIIKLLVTNMYERFMFVGWPASPILQPNTHAENLRQDRPKHSQDQEKNHS
jgi:hypothetical protein